VTTRPPVRLLHTSDVHLGMHDGADPLARGRSESGLRGVVDIGLRERVDLMVVAGDLFDHARVHEATLRLAAAEFARIGAPVVVVPGNHDHAGAGSVYDRLELTALAPNLTVLRAPGGETITFAALGVTVWGRPYCNQGPDFAPFAGAPRRRGTPPRASTWAIGVGHGHYMHPESVTHPSFRFDEAELLDLDFDYIALGHWERQARVAAGGIVATYSGTPASSADGHGGVLLVDFNATGEVVLRAQSLGVGGEHSHEAIPLLAGA
jgi:DNA repair protein SbcD/Mre11